jgi:hypothetical protein
LIVSKLKGGEGEEEKIEKRGKQSSLHNQIYSMISMQRA